MNIPKLYWLQPFTNVHVGSGNADFGVVDNLIQRDPASGLPYIQSSSLKGAIKQLSDLHQVPEKDQQEIFGSDASVNKKGGNRKSQQGASVFLSAQLFALPIRTDRVPFVLATCPGVLLEWRRTIKDLNLTLPVALEKAIQALIIGVADHGSICLQKSLKGAELSASGAQLAHLDSNDASALGDWVDSENLEKLCVVSDTFFIEQCNDLNLPVIARNVLDDGQSVNLWYEQVLPRRSLLFYGIIWKDSSQQKTIEDILLQQPLQVGGNASVGYGFTRTYKINL
jgi:CRISPR-associated protein Cmr4